VIAEHQGQKTGKDNVDLSQKLPGKKSRDQIQRIVKLGQTNSQSGVPELIAALKNPDGNARRLAASALGKIRTCLATEPLLKLLESEVKPQVRQYAIKALGSIGDKRAASMLERILSDEKELYYVRKSAENALKRIKNSPAGKVVSTGLLPEAKTLDSEIPDNDIFDSVVSFLNTFHPRPLAGPWQCGWSLGFHSRFTGGDWVRSGTGDLTYRLKYEGDLTALPPLVEKTLALLAKHPDLASVDAILPVPPSQSRETDPVQAFSSALSDKIRIPVQRLLVKTRQTEPQKELKTLSQKRSNVNGAFAVTGSVTGKHILVLDDLFDSGATLEEITRLLLKSGAASVNVLTLTRTIHSDL
jgi:competence protein ComFC